MRFESVVVLRAQLFEMLGEQVPNNLTFDVGYFGGSQHSKIWLCSNSDLEAMYCNYPRGEITLWCSGSAEVEAVGNGKRKRDDSGTGTFKTAEERRRS